MVKPNNNSSKGQIQNQGVVSATEKINSTEYALKWVVLVLLLGISADLMALGLLYWAFPQDYDSYRFITGEKLFAFSVCLTSAIFIDICFYKHELSRKSTIATTAVLIFSIVLHTVCIVVNPNNEHLTCLLGYMVLVGSVIVAYYHKSLIFEREN